MNADISARERAKLNDVYEYYDYLLLPYELDTKAKYKQITAAMEKYRNNHQHQ